MTKRALPKVQPAERPWRRFVYKLIFEADTPLGILFDVLLLIAILGSVIVVCIETTYPTGDPMIGRLMSVEWIFTLFFTAEYLLRIICVRNPLRYIFSFFGIVDLLACLPGFLLLWSDRSASFTVVRLFRIIRVFRLFKLGWFVSEADDLGKAVWQARAKVVVFLTVVMITVTIAGAMMYELERHENSEPFSSIPLAIYWAIITMTTVGYGDIVPKSIAGKFLSAMLIMIGYSLIIVPTGFVSAEIMERKKRAITTRVCDSCFFEGHDRDAKYCKACGASLQ